MIRQRPGVYWVLFTFFVCLFGCAKEQSESESSQSAAHLKTEMPVPSITDAEAERGKQACNAYIERLCKCSESHEEYVKTCELAKAMPSALKMNLRTAQAEGNLERRDKSAVVHSARQIIRRCIENEVRLDDQKCPRPTKLSSKTSE